MNTPMFILAIMILIVLTIQLTIMYINYYNKKHPKWEQVYKFVKTQTLKGTTYTSSETKYILMTKYGLDVKKSDECLNHKYDSEPSWFIANI